MKPFLVVAGLAREARLAEARDNCALSGADCELLRARLSGVDPSAFAGVLSFGLAGGLDPALKPGALLIGQRAVAPGAAYDCNRKFSEQIAQRLTANGVRFTEGAFVGVEQPLMNPQEKDALFRKTRARAVDMESHIAGDFAARARLPFAILRAVSDPADTALPPLALGAIGPDGRVRVAQVLLGLARQPRQLSALRAAQRDSAAAFATLARAGRAVATL